jgi:hypothetical protein
MSAWWLACSRASTLRPTSSPNSAFVVCGPQRGLTSDIPSTRNTQVLCAFDRPYIDYLSRFCLRALKMPVAQSICRLPQNVLVLPLKKCTIWYFSRAVLYERRMSLRCKAAIAIETHYCSGVGVPTRPWFWSCGRPKMAFWGDTDSLFSVLGHAVLATGCIWAVVHGLPCALRQCYASAHNVLKKVKKNRVYVQ